MLPGVTIAMGGRDWLVPPLTLGQLRRLMPKVRQLTEIGASMGETQIGVLVEIVAAALQRNYPEATAEMVENLLDLGNASAVLNAVLTGSGLKLRDSFPGEAAAPGAGPGAGSTVAAPMSDPNQGGGDGWGPRHRLRLQLFGNRRYDALRCRRAHSLLGRASAGAYPAGSLSRRRQTTAQPDTIGPLRTRPRSALRSQRDCCRTRPRVWHRRCSCRSAGGGARFCRASEPG